MYIKVRAMTGGDPATITVSKLTTVQDLRDLVKERFQVEPEHQNLFFQGKKMEDEFTLFDYSVKVNDMIQLMVRKPLGSLDNVPGKPVKDVPVKDVPMKEAVKENINVCDAESSVYKIEEGVDVRDRDTGAWFEARISKITKNDSVSGGDGLAYYVQYEGYPDYGPTPVKYEEIRPRARSLLPFVELDLGMEVCRQSTRKCPLQSFV